MSVNCTQAEMQDTCSMSTAATFDPVQGFLPGGFGALQEVVAAAEQVGQAPLWSCSTQDLEHVLGLIGWVGHHLGQLERHVVAEGMTRGLPVEAGACPVDWVTSCLHEMVPAPPPGHAAQVVRLAKAQDVEAYEGLFARLGVGEVSVSKADQLVRFHQEVASVADPVSLAGVFEVLVQGASDTKELVPGEPGCGVRTRGITDRQLSTAIGRAKCAVKPAADLAEGEERARAGRVLFARPGPAGMTEYRWVLDPEGAAVVDAALAGSSGPRPAQDGTPDPRSGSRRRADALLDLVRGGASCPDETLPAAENPGRGHHHFGGPDRGPTRGGHHHDWSGVLPRGGAPDGL